MRKSLGRIFLIFLIFFQVEIFASTYEWSVYSNKERTYTGEAVYLKYICSFSDRAELYAIDFTPLLDTDRYRLKLLSQNERITDGKKVNTYEYVAFVKTAGTLIFDFDVTMKKTTKESIENTVIGRDNVEREEFSKKVIPQKKLILEVIDANSDLVGAFTMQVKQDKAQIKAYEPYHLEIVINGSGNFDSIKPFEFNIDGVKVFAANAVKDTELTKDGLSGSFTQKFAFVSEQSFDIPNVSFSYFDLNDKKIKIISSETAKIEVIKGFEKAELLDEEEEKLTFSFEYVYYFLTFMAGFLVAKIKFKKREVKNIKRAKFEEKVEDVKSSDELMMILILQDATKYKDIIFEIENNKNKSLNSLKKEVINI